MKVLIACEFSGIMRSAFAMFGHDSISCDLINTEIPGKHIIGNVLNVIEREHFDLMIAHPPCRYLAVSGARWFKERQLEQRRALQFVKELMGSPIEYIALENPVSVISSKIRKPDQIIQPYQFGHGETKRTCLWLKNLPPLKPFDIVDGREHRIHRMGPGPNRRKERSRTYPGIAFAMAKQWTDYLPEE